MQNVVDHWKDIGFNTKGNEELLKSYPKRNKAGDPEGSDW
jgi:hypothetical protein